jgi:glycosylphosphatidylinositol transamidase (GPIT) subunit GPI8
MTPCKTTGHYRYQKGNLLNKMTFLRQKSPTDFFVNKNNVLIKDFFAEVKDSRLVGAL